MESKEYYISLIASHTKEYNPQNEMFAERKTK